MAAMRDASQPSMSPDAPVRARRAAARPSARRQRGTPARRESGSAGEARSDAANHALSRVLLEGRLVPGTPLRERYLAEVFGITRGAVRKLLLRLGHEGKLQIIANRGAFVPQPSDADIRQIYDARKAVESGVAALLAPSITGTQLARLRAHVREERRALQQGRRDESVKLAGAFHLELVQALGNPELGGIVDRLVGRTRMFVALFEPARESGCAPHEHEAIVEALGAQDGPGAAAAMVDHLRRVEARVIEHVGQEERRPLGDILREALGQTRGRG
jgi:DNA-binding GntR family transcriptional regulator